MNLTAKDALGYQQLTSLGTAAGLTIPAGTDTVLLQAEVENVRYRDDGTDPTASVGMILVENTIYEFGTAQLARMKFIEVVAGAKLNVCYYGTRTA